MDERVGKDGETVVFAFSITDKDLMVVEVNVFDAQPHGLHDSESASVHDLGDEFGCSTEAGDETFDFVFGEDDGNGFGALGAVSGKFEFVQLDVEDVTVEEEDGTEGLILSGGGDVLV